MSRPMNPEIAKLMAGGMAYDAARMKLRRQRPSETLQAESVPSAPVEAPEELEENHDAITALVAELSEGEPDIVILCKAKDRAPFERRMDGESSVQFNARWEGYTARYGYDPAGRRGGWEPSWREELAARSAYTAERLLNAMQRIDKQDSAV